MGSWNDGLRSSGGPTVHCKRRSENCERQNLSCQKNESNLAKKKISGPAKAAESDRDAGGGSTPNSNGDAEPMEDENFESTLQAIENSVRDLESGELTLDESLKSYERAVRQLRRCYALLEAAEQKISVLAGVDAEGNPILQPMVSSEEGTASADSQPARAGRRVAIADNNAIDGDE